MTIPTLWSSSIRRMVAVLAVLLGPVLPGALLAAEPGETVGRVIRIHGYAVSVAGQAAPRPLSTDAAVNFQEELVTGAAARLLVRLEDGTEITLGENARLIIDTFVYDPARGEAGASVLVPAGAFSVITGAIAKLRPQAMSFKTPVATIGIRGTDFWGGPIDGVYGVLLRSGRVEVRNDAGLVELESNQGTTMSSPDTAPAIPTTWSEGRITRASQSVAFP